MGVFKRTNMGVSKIGVHTPKSSILIGLSIINHPFWGTTILDILGNTHMFNRVCRMRLFVSNLLEFEAIMIFCCWVVVGHCGVFHVERVRIDLVLSIDMVHSLSAFAMVEEAGSEFAYPHCSLYSQKLYI